MPVIVAPLMGSSLGESRAASAAYGLCTSAVFAP
jgi:hypothetical protein